MALGFIAALFGRRIRLPRDHVKRLPRAAKKAAKEHIDAMFRTVEAIGAMQGIADVKQQKRVPRGFYEAVESYYAHYDAFADLVRKHLGLEDSKRPGEPGGCGACYAAPMGLHAIETLNLYRKVRAAKWFPQAGQYMAELGEQQFKDIQVGHTGKDPEKIRMGGKAVQAGRLRFAKRRQPCPFLNVEKQRCRIWEQRPVVCRMHHPTTPLEWSDPEHDGYPKQVKARNIRTPIKVQVALAQLDKRMMLELSPFMFAGILQLAQLKDGELIQEVGEAPLRMQQDGRIAQRANRNVGHAKKYKKKKKKKK